MVKWVYACVQTYQVVHINYMQFFVYKVRCNEPGKKEPNKGGSTAPSSNQLRCRYHAAAQISSYLGIFCHRPLKLIILAEVANTELAVSYRWFFLIPEQVFLTQGFRHLCFRDPKGKPESLSTCPPPAAAPRLLCSCRAGAPLFMSTRKMLAFAYSSPQDPGEQYWDGLVESGLRGGWIKGYRPQLLVWT